MQRGPVKTRGAPSNRTGRFEALAVERVDDGWGIADEALPPFETTVQPEPARPQRHLRAAFLPRDVQRGH